jgi:hypothetical protein
MKAKTDSFAIPVIDVVKERAIVIAGFANAVLDVKRIPPNIHRGAYIAIKSSRLGNLKIIQTKPAVASTSETNKFEPLRAIDDWASVDWSKK